MKAMEWPYTVCTSFTFSAGHIKENQIPFSLCGGFPWSIHWLAADQWFCVFTSPQRCNWALSLTMMWTIKIASATLNSNNYWKNVIWAFVSLAVSAQVPACMFATSDPYAIWAVLLSERCPLPAPSSFYRCRLLTVASCTAFMTSYVLIVLGLPEGGLSQTKFVSDHYSTHFHTDLQMILLYTHTPCGSVHFHVDFPTLIWERGESWHSFHVI